MAMEELDEFEVLWPDTCHTHTDHDPPPVPVITPISSPVQPSESPTPCPKQRCSARSRPVDVPGAARLRRWKYGDEEENDGGDGKKIVPPHLLTSGRRRSEGGSATATAAAAASTLRSGRPCKRARDLHHLRNSVLRMTGFIEG